jgi:hypothetical protein
VKGCLHYINAACSRNYITENSIGNSTIPDTFKSALGINSNAINTSAGTSNGGLIFQRAAGKNPNFGK